MKRILFWASGMFALGEVAYLYADRIANYSIALAMLICVALVYLRKRKLLSQVLFLCGFAIFGFLYILMWDRARPVSLRMNQNSMTMVGDEASFTVYVSGNKEKESYHIVDRGIVVDVSREEKSLIIKFGRGIGEYRIIVYEVDGDYGLGECVNVEGIVSTIQEANNPGTMNMRKYYGGRGILFSATASDLSIHKEKNQIFSSGISMRWYEVCNKLFKVRDYLIKKIYDITDHKTAGFLVSLLLGDKSYLDEEVKTLFSMSGLSHILVISGMHISLISAFAYKMFNVLGINKVLSAFCTIFFIILYGNMTGASFATLRAVIMIIISIMGDRLSKDYDMLTAMSFALLFLLLRNPFSILDGGMILSFFAIGGVELGNYMKKTLVGIGKLKKMKKKKPLLYYVVSTFLMSMAVNLMLTPIIANLYYGVPIYSLLLNIIIVPFMGIVIGVGILGLVLSLVVPIWGWIIYIPIKHILYVMMWLCDITTDLPLSYVNTGRIGIESMLIYYGGLFVFFVLINPKIQKYIRDSLYTKKHISFSKKVWLRIWLILGTVDIALTGILFCFTHKSNQYYGAVFVDVGQGDGTLIKTKEGLNIVVDGGSSSNENLGQYVLSPMLKYYNMANVDYWFISHSDEDHISGLVEILEEGKLSGISIEHIVIGGKFLEDDKLVYIMTLARKQETEVIIMKPGDYILQGNTKITCLSPDKNYPYKDKNQASMALSFESPYFNILFTGDMDKDGLEYMMILNQGVLSKKYDVIKIPHHGSKYSLHNELYALAEDGYGVISAGVSNLYGHPHKEVLDELEYEGVKCLVTSEVGGIIVKIR